MNRLTLWLGNVAFAVLACAATVWVLGQSPREALVAAKGDDARAARGDRKADRKGASREAHGDSDQAAGNPAADADILWQQSLFRPERTEDPTAPVVEDPAVAAAALNLELVGLARVGERAVAVIVQHRGQGPTRRPGVPGGAAAPGGPRPGVLKPPTPPAVGPAEAAGGDAEGPPDRHVYKIGDGVGDSGYTLKDIRLKEKEVVLTRGSEERVLKLETADDQSSSRREAAAAQAIPPKPPEPAPQPGVPKPPGEGAVAAAAAAAAAAQAGPPGLPPPPPPPGVAGGAPGAPGTPGAPGAIPAEGVPAREGTAAVPMTREERLERARLLRERILQGRTPATTP